MYRKFKHRISLISRYTKIYSLYCISFFSVGLFTAAFGTIVKDLQSQVHESITPLSFICVEMAIGFIAGSFASVLVLNKYETFIMHKYLPSDTQVYDLIDSIRVELYLLSLPKIAYPLTPHNIFSICLFISGINMIIIPFIKSIYIFSVLLIINSFCFGIINNLGNVCFVALFDNKINPKILKLFKLNLSQNKKRKSIHSNINFYIDPNIKQQETETETIDLLNTNRDRGHAKVPTLTSFRSSYGSISLAQSDLLSEIGNNDKYKEPENNAVHIGPYMNGLQAVLAFGGFMAPLLIELSFLISNNYLCSFVLFALFDFIVGFLLFYHPTPIRMSVISNELKERRKRTMIRISESSVTNRSNSNYQDIDFVNELELKQYRFAKKMVIASVSIFLCLYISSLVSSGMYITVHSVDHINATKSIERILVGLDWFGLLVGRLIAIPISKRLSPMNMVIVDIIGLFIGSLMLYFNIKSTMVLFAFIGICMASLWPSVFLWLESLTILTSLFGAIMTSAGNIGAFLIPIAQVKSVGIYGTHHFADILLSMAVLLLIWLFMNMIVAKRINKFGSRFK